MSILKSEGTLCQRANELNQANQSVKFGTVTLPTPFAQFAKPHAHPSILFILLSPLPSILISQLKCFLSAQFLNNNNKWEWRSNIYFQNQA